MNNTLETIHLTWAWQDPIMRFRFRSATKNVINTLAQITFAPTMFMSGFHFISEKATFFAYFSENGKIVDFYLNLSQNCKNINRKNKINLEH